MIVTLSIYCQNIAVFNSFDRMKIYNSLKDIELKNKRYRVSFNILVN